MFQLDDNFLNDIGLGQLPEEQRKAFLEHVYSQLELRVGTRLSEGLSDEQIDQFGSFIDRDMEKVNSWISQYAPDYQNDRTYIQLRQSAGDNANEDVVLAEYASLRWLNLNRPDYRDVVKQVLEEIKQEIISNKDAILAGS